MFSLGMGTAALTFVLLPRFIERHDRLLLATAALLGCTATILYANASRAPLPLVQGCAGSALVGFCHGWLMVRSLAALCQLAGPGHITGVCGTALMVKTLLDQLFCQLPYFPGLFVCAVLPWVAGACVTLAGPLETGISQPRPAGSPKSSPTIRTTVIMLIMNSVLHAITRSISTLGFWGTPFSPKAVSGISLLASCLLLAIVLYLAVARARGDSPFVRYAPAYLVLLAGFFALDPRVQEALSMPPEAVHSLEITVELYAHALYWTVGIACARCVAMDPVRTLGIAVLVMNAAAVVASALLQQISQAGNVLVVGATYLFTAAMALLAQRGRQTGQDQPAATPLAPAEANRHIYERLAQQAGLTPRETEVFILLAQGRDRGHISRELFISDATIKTHSRHIYAKLDVTNKQELISYVNQHLDT